MSLQVIMCFNRVSMHCGYSATTGYVGSFVYPTVQGRIYYILLQNESVINTCLYDTCLFYNENDYNYMYVDISEPILNQCMDTNPDACVIGHLLTILL